MIGKIIVILLCFSACVCVFVCVYVHIVHLCSKVNPTLITYSQFKFRGQENVRSLISAQIRSIVIKGGQSLICQ